MITIVNVSSIINISESQVAKATLAFFERQVCRSYSDNVLKEHIYSAYVEDEYFDEETSSDVLQEVAEITRLAEKEEADYVRFTS